jgi:hypothetical protein
VRRLVPIGTAVVTQLVTHPPLRPELQAAGSPTVAASVDVTLGRPTFGAVGHPRCCTSLLYCTRSATSSGATHYEPVFGTEVGSERAPPRADEWLSADGG